MPASTLPFVTGKRIRGCDVGGDDGRSGRRMTQAPDSPLPFPVPQYSKAPMTVPYGDRQGFNFRSSTRPHCDRLRRRQRYGGSPICR